MKAEELVSGQIYRMQAGDFAEFSYMGGTGYAIFHPPGEPSMQDSRKGRSYCYFRGNTKM